jgi:hypothetical protein
MKDGAARYFESRDNRVEALPEATRLKFKEAMNKAPDPEAWADRQFMSLYFSQKTGKPHPEVYGKLDGYLKHYGYENATEAYNAISKHYSQFQNMEPKRAVKREVGQISGIAAQYGANMDTNRAVQDAIGSILAGFPKIAQSLPAGMFRGAAEMVANQENRMVAGPGFGMIPQQWEQAQPEAKAGASKFEKWALENADYFREYAESMSDKMGVSEEFQNSAWGSFFESAGGMPAFMAMAVLGGPGVLGMGSVMYEEASSDRMKTLEAKGEKYKPGEAFLPNMSYAVPATLIERAMGTEALMNKIIKEGADQAGKMGFKEFASKVIKSMLKAGGQEAIEEPTQGFLQDFLASIDYDKGRELFSEEALKTRLLEAVSAFVLASFFGGGIQTMANIDTQRRLKKYVTAKDGHPLTPQDFDMVRSFKTDEQIRAGMKDQDRANLLIRALNGDQNARMEYNMELLRETGQGVEESFVVGEAGYVKAQDQEFLVGSNGQVVVVDESDPESIQIRDQMMAERDFLDELEAQGQTEEQFEAQRAADHYYGSKLRKMKLPMAKNPETGQFEGGEMESEYGISEPTVETIEGRYAVVDPEGEILEEFDTAEEAEAYALQDIEQQLDQAVPEVREMMDYIEGISEREVVREEGGTVNLREQMEKDGFTEEEMITRIRDLTGREDVGLEALERVVILGSNRLETKRGIVRDVYRITKGANPTTPIEERAELYFKMRHRVEGDAFLELVQDWKNQYEAEGGEQRYGNGYEGLGEFFSDRAIDYVLGSEGRPEFEAANLPASFRSFLIRLRQMFHHLIRRAEQFMGMIDEGMVDEPFIRELQRAVGFDQTYIQQHSWASKQMAAAKAEAEAELLADEEDLTTYLNGKFMHPETFKELYPEKTEEYSHLMEIWDLTVKVKDQLISPKPKPKKDGSRLRGFKPYMRRTVTKHELFQEKGVQQGTHPEAVVEGLQEDSPFTQIQTIDDLRNAIEDDLIGGRKTYPEYGKSEWDQRDYGMFQLARHGSDADIEITETYQLTEVDREYMGAVESGDMDKAQAMVDEAAKKAGYDIGPVYHGTTHQFNIFTTERGNPENDFGLGFYFSNSEEDVEANYKGMGPDLTQRVELLSERIQSEDEDISEEEAEAQARERLVGGGQRIIPAYIKLDNPVVLGGWPKSETIIEPVSRFDEDVLDDLRDQAIERVREEYDLDPDGDLQNWESEIRETQEEIAEDNNYFNEEVHPIIEAINRVSIEFEEVQEIPESVYEYTQDETEARHYEKILREEVFPYAMDPETGDNVTGEATRRVFEILGFDGIIDQTVNRKFGTTRQFGKAMAGMNADTFHVIAFESNQIKSADPVTYDEAGNVVPLSRRFDLSRPEITYQLGEADPGHFLDPPSASRLPSEQLTDKVDAYIRKKREGYLKQIEEEETNPVAIKRKAIRHKDSYIAQQSAYFLMPVSSRLGLIDKGLQAVVRRHFMNVALRKNEDTRRIEPFLKRIAKIPAEEREALKAAWINSDMETMKSLALRFGFRKQLDEVRAVLENLHERYKNADIDIGYIQDYFPRHITDLDGLLQSYYGHDQYGLITEALEEAKSKAKDRNRKLTPDEEIQIVNSVLRGFKRGQPSRPSNTKARKTKTVDSERLEFTRTRNTLCSITLTGPMTLLKPESFSANTWSRKRKDK